MNVKKTIKKTPYFEKLNYLRFKIMFNLRSDENELKARYKKIFGRYPNLIEPKFFSEKIIWRICNENDTRFSELSDKYAVRKYVEDKIGSEYLIPLIGVFKNAKDIDFNKLPKKYVLKCNHDSGSVIISDGINKFNINKSISKLNTSLSLNYYHCTREKHYESIKPLIICEEFISENGNAPRDYKFHMFKMGNEHKIFIQVDNDRFSEHTRNIYDESWNLMPFRITKNNSKNPILPPKNLHKMLNLAKVLSDDFSYIRVDFYEVNEKIYFGELTFTSFSGLEAFFPESWDLRLGEYWQQDIL
ncbi:ATP-grasp fold amidoligase family protein [Photobacterium phosphoreum]|uniref:ATP-grasp fold amidoligase family protein n=1 Tax=Photobacterium phosphoreum TaxID=659 RepID=UPI0039B0C90C